MSIFNVDFTKLSNRLTPSFLKSTAFSDWIKSLLNPVVTLYNDLLAYREESFRILSYNSRTKIFEEYLNDEFDATLRRIYIVNNTNILQRVFIYFTAEGNVNPYIYNISESKPPLYIRTSNEFALDVDFTVYYPNGLIFDSNKMTSIIKSVKLAGKRFAIIPF